MRGSEMSLSDAERVALGSQEESAALQMDEDAFRAFYDRTSRPLWAYLCRVTGSPHAADDLLQEAYYRFLRAAAPLESEAHRRHYLFRVATNLLRDRPRTSREQPLDEAIASPRAGVDDIVAGSERRSRLRAAMGGMKRRERQLLWLAYGEGSSHQEIAGILGVKATAVRVLLFRARRKLAQLLRAAGWGDGGRDDTD